MTGVEPRRIGLLLLLMALLAVGGCTRTVYYAVIAPTVSVSDGRSCFRQCQMLRAAGTKQYLACLNTCPDVRVVNESECEAVAIDRAQYACTTEHNQTFSPGPGIAVIVVAVLVLFIAAAASEPSMPRAQ
jgi:hypothetical protein